MNRMTVQRTDWAEEFVAGFLGLPLAIDTILLRPQRRDRVGDREVCDVLFALRRAGVAVSLKSQQDPRGRRGGELEAWCAKHSRTAVSQLGGAVRTLAERPLWCLHPRRGRVEIEAGALDVLHAIAAVETWEPVALPPDLPERAPGGVPLTYLSTNDLLNVAVELRAFPDIVAYLDARLTLPLAVRRTIGHERVLCAYYLLNDESFDGCDSLDIARASVECRDVEWRDRLRKKKTLDGYAEIAEHVFNALLPTDEPHNLRLQEELCDLRLGARRLLGRAFATTRAKLAESAEPQGMTYMAVPDAKPNFAFAIGATRGVERAEVKRRARVLVLGALAQYGHLRGTAICDLESDRTFEFVYVQAADAAEIQRLAGEAGRVLFGKLRLKAFETGALPHEGW
jgi:hypothetical protein